MDCDSYEPWHSEEACASVKTDFENYTRYSLPCDPCFVEGDYICLSNSHCVPPDVCVDGVCSVGGDADSSGDDSPLPVGSGSGDGPGTIEGNLGEVSYMFIRT